MTSPSDSTSAVELGTLSDTFERIEMALLTVIEAKDLTLRRHCERVAKYAVQLAEQIDLDATMCNHLFHGALLHDIGNVGIPDSILLKPTGLAQWEFEEMKLHPIIGEQICKPLGSLSILRPLIRSHHEKLDGSGYPDGLSGDEIPHLVKVLSVADVYDSLRGERAYRQAFTHQEAIDILKDEADRGWWDPTIVALLADIIAPDADFAPV